MSETDAEIVSCHLRIADRDAVIRALRQAAACGAPIGVWPPRPLPPAILLSPERYGWHSLWGMPEPCDALIPELTATLECTGVVFRVVEDEYWLMEIVRDGRLVARLSSPEAVSEDLLLYERAWDSLAAAGTADPGADEGQLAARIEALRHEQMAEADLSAAQRDALRALLPVGASLEDALSLLRAWDRVDSGEEAGEGPEFVEDALETFANYLGIRDAAWDPRGDYEALSAGDYEESDGLPEGWESSLLLPFTHWNLPLA